MEVKIAGPGPIVGKQGVIRLWGSVRLVRDAPRNEPRGQIHESATNSSSGATTANALVACGTGNERRPPRICDDFYQ